MFWKKNHYACYNPAMNYYISATPGRLRIHSPRLHNNHDEIKKFELFIASVNGIEKIETNTLTGSALMHYDEKQTNCERLLFILESSGYFDLMKAETPDELAEKAAEEAAKLIIDVITDELA
ncbi:MAG: hypothetical protein HQK97_11515 [Nitrospirae bacterium]|nr:hypothetical protein [Nitrospirota bacterium]